MTARSITRLAVAVGILTAVVLAPTPAFAALEPPPPRSLSASAGDGYVQLRWAAPEETVATVDAYEVIRDGVAVHRTADLSYVDTSALNGTTYRYAVRAHNSFGWSEPSQEVTATPQPALTGTMQEQDPSSAPPTGLTARLVADARKAELKWTAPPGAAEVLRYRVYRSVDSDVSLELAGEIRDGVTRFHDRMPPNARAVYYYVSAVYATGESPLSNSAYVDGPCTWC